MLARWGHCYPLPVDRCISSIVSELSVFPCVFWCLVFPERLSSTLLCCMDLLLVTGGELAPSLLVDSRGEGLSAENGLGVIPIAAACQPQPVWQAASCKSSVSIPTMGVTRNE